MLDPRSARWLVLAGGLLFATGGAAVKACSFGAWQVAGIRSGLAALVILALVPGSRRRWTRSTMLVAVAYAATLTLYITANKLTTAANAIFLQSTAPLYILALSPMLLGERASRRDLGVAAAIALGITFIFLAQEQPRGTAPNPALGDTLAVFSGVTWALTLLGMRYAGRTDHTAAAGAVVAGNVLTFAVAMPFAWPLEAGAAMDWVWLGYLGLAQVGLAYVFVTRAMSSLPAVQISLILMIEPAINPVIAWLVHGETPARVAMAGGGVILIALVANGLRREAREGR